MESESGASVQIGASGGRDAWTCEFDPRNGRMREITLPSPAAATAATAAAAAAPTADVAPTATTGGATPPEASARHASCEAFEVVSSRSQAELVAPAKQAATSAAGQALTKIAPGTGTDAIHQAVVASSDADPPSPRLSFGVTGGGADDIPLKGAQSRQAPQMSHDDDNDRAGGGHQVDSSLPPSLTVETAPVALGDTRTSDLKPESIGNAATAAAAAAAVEMAAQPTAQSFFIGGSKFAPLSPEGGRYCGGEGQAGFGDGEKGGRTLAEVELTPALEGVSGMVGSTDEREVAQAVRVEVVPGAAEPARKSYPGMG